MWKGEKALIIATATFPCLVDVVQVATGGTLSAGIELVKKLGGVVVECSCVRYDAIYITKKLYKSNPCNHCAYAFPVV